ncbi:MAG: nitroreductase [Anaerolinea sp.]|nr:nitroreductase [Anaerolinea sp.]
MGASPTPRIPMPELLPALSQRRARRAFEPRPVQPDLLNLLWQAISVAPSHGNTQSARILLAESAEVHDRLVAALSPGNSHWAGAAPHLFALVALPAHETPQENSDGTLRDMWPFNAGIAIGNLMAQATFMGLTAHPMAGFDEPAVRAVFGAPPSVRVLTVVAVGYPGSPDSLPEDLAAKETMPQERLPLERILAVDRWDPVLEVSAREWRKQQQPA